jgi:hypothetical protein
MDQYNNILAPETPIPSFLTVCLFLLLSLDDFDEKLVCSYFNWNDNESMTNILLVPHGSRSCPLGAILSLISF